jgi:hypothetical protein
MVSSEHIEELLRQTPFQPFTIRMSDGWDYKVERAEQARLETETVAIVFARAVHQLSLAHVARLEHDELKGPRLGIPS